MFVLGGLNKTLIEEARMFASTRGCTCVVPEIRNNIELPNLGQHYVENASLSMKAAQLFIQRISNHEMEIPAGVHPGLGSGAGMTNLKVYDDALALKTLATRSWTGRMQKLVDSNGNTQFILDGAHNSHAVRRLVETLDEY